MKVISVATWRVLDLFSGIPERLIKFHTDLGLTAICIKFGNGLRKWSGLKLLVDLAMSLGLKPWGWWYCYGYNGEGTVIGEHAQYLGLTLVALDIEREWESRAGWSRAARERKGAQLIAEIRATGYVGDLALCSWWHAEGNPRVPYKVLLEHCKYNMPQMYWIGRYSEQGAADLVSTSLDMYSRICNFPALLTIPVLASFGQSYGRTKRWWKATVPQMQAAHKQAEIHGCEGSIFYSADYLLGGAGHEYPKGIPEQLMIDAIRKMNNSLPVPNKPRITIEGKPDTYDLRTIG